MEDDPRAKEVTEFLHKKKELDEQPPDYRCLIALMLGIMSYQLEVPSLALVGLICLVSSLSNSEYESVDWPQLTATLATLCLGISSGLGCD